MHGKLVSILTTERAGDPLRQVAEAELRAGHGLVNDRYFHRRGTFSEKLAAGSDWEITLIEFEEIERFNQTRTQPLSPESFRRNLVTCDIRLDDLIELEFHIGSAVLEGIRLCEPCAYLGSFLGPDVVPAMAHKCGLRARIVHGAVIRPGDRIVPG